MEDESFIENGIEKRNLLQLEVMKYAIRTRELREEEWVEKFSAQFSELYENTNISERFDSVMDKNPDEFYEWIQSSLDSLVSETS